MESDNAFLDYSFINFASTESLLTTSQYAKVIFHNIEEKYNYHEDLICTYSLTEQFVIKTGDRIVLFKLGWQQATDYVLFQWVESPAVEGNCLQVNFKADSLPRDVNEFYQLCYISGENTVCGASIPFQFKSLGNNLVASTDSDFFISLQMESSKTLMPTQSTSSLRTDFVTTEISRVSNEPLKSLVEDNKQIKEELKITNTSLRDCDSQISDLKSEIDSLKDMLRLTQNDVSHIKIRMDESNDEYKKLFAEKTRVEKKYDKLVRKCHAKAKKPLNSNDLSEDYLGELDPLPPFPILM